MGFTIRLALHNLLQRPGRTLFSVLGIAVGILTVVLVFTLDHNTMIGRRKAVGGDEWSAELEVRPKQGLTDARSDLRQMEGVAELSAQFQNDIQIYRADGNQPTNVREPFVLPGQKQPDRKRARLIALEADAASRLRVYQLREGRDFAATTSGARECLIGLNLAQRLSISLGDTVFLSKPVRTARSICRDGENVQTEIAGAKVVQDWPFTVVGILESELVGRKSGGQVILVDYQDGVDLYEGTLVDPSYWVKRNPEVDATQLQTELSAGFSFDLNQSVVVGQAADERAFRNGVRFAGLFALVLGLYVIFHTLSMSLIERVREVGLLGALGATRRQVAGIFFGEAFVIAVIAGAIGVASGLWGARWLLRHGITTVGVGKSIGSFEIPWDLVLPLALLGVGIALIGSIYPLMRAQKANIASVLRGESQSEHHGAMARGFQLFAAVLLVIVLPGLYFVIAPVVGGVGSKYLGLILAGVAVLMLLVGIPLLVPSILSWTCGLITKPFDNRWPLAGQLASRSIRSSPARVSASVAAIALVTAAFVGLKGMTNSLQGEIEDWAEDAIDDRLWVRGLPDVTAKDLHSVLADRPEVLAIEAGDARHYAPFLLIGIDPEEMAKSGPCKEDPSLLRGLQTGQGAIISKRIAKRYEWQVGDTINVHTTGHGQQSLPILAISDYYGYFPRPDERLYVVVASDLLRNYFCVPTDTSNYVSLRLEPGSDPEPIIAQLKNHYGKEHELNFDSDEYIINWHVEDITRDFFLFDVILSLTALLAGLGVLNGQLLTALERWKEVGVLRAMGMSHSQLAGMVLLESIVIGLVGGGLGLALGAGLTPVIVEALQVISSLDLPVRSAGAWLGLSLAGAVAVSALAGFYPIWRMNRFDALRAVRSG